MAKSQEKQREIAAALTRQTARRLQSRKARLHPTRDDSDGIPSIMTEPHEILERAKSSRDRARAVAQQSSKLLRETARLEATLQKAEAQVKELKENARAIRKDSRRNRKRT